MHKRMIFFSLLLLQFYSYAEFTSYQSGHRVVFNGGVYLRQGERVSCSCNRSNQWPAAGIPERNYSFAYYSVSDFERIFSIAFEKEIFNNFELFAYESFRIYARGLPGYNDFILELDRQIKNDKRIRKKTACVPGFSYEFSVRSEKSGFHAILA